VISTDPAADTAVNAGDLITINVSTGPEQAQVPDVTDLTPSQARDRLKKAGFEKVKESASSSTPEQKGRVIATSPPANQTAAIINEITIVVGSGPGTKSVPDCSGLNVGDCQRILTESGFLNTLPVDVDSPRPAGQIVGTSPAMGPNVPVDTVIQIQVSRGNQFIMPDLRGMFWDNAYPTLQSLGWTGTLVKLPNAQNSGVPSNGVVTQNPAAGSGVNFGASITLSFAS
jgi:serine/threonine-protein kinase